MKSFLAIVRIDGTPDAYSQKNIRMQLLAGIGISGALNPDNVTILVVEELRTMPDLESKEPLSDEDSAYLNNMRESLEARRDSFNALIGRIMSRLMPGNETGD